MEDYEQYKLQIESMQKYVPLLSKFIKDLEEKGNSSGEGLGELKNLLQQIYSTKQRIPLEELHKCELVLKDLFESPNTIHIQNDEDQKILKVNGLEIEHTQEALLDDNQEYRNVPVKKFCIESRTSLNVYRKGDDRNSAQNDRREIDSELANSSDSCDQMQHEAKDFEISSEIYEEEHVEIIVCSDNEGEEDGELIVPDEENFLVDESLSDMEDVTLQNCENSNAWLENSKLTQESKTANGKKLIDCEDEVTTDMAKSRNDINEETNIVTITQYFKNKENLSQNIDEELKTDECSSIENRKTDPVSITSEESVIKRQKLSIFNYENDELCNDPLAVDDKNDTALITNPSCTYNDNNDDIEVIEQSFSPILIDSDDDVKLIEHVPKPQIKKPSFAFKSTNPNKIRDSKVEDNQCLKPNRIVNIRNQKPTEQKNANPSHFNTYVGRIPILIPNAFYGASRYQSTSSVRNSEQNKLASQLPRKASSNVAHCRWLNNFLQHFCKPRNIAHNTCYMLLKPALHREDFERIYKQRSMMKKTINDTNYHLLSQLKNIFYVDGNHMSQELTFVGRKFCQLAFINILDKTISLTTDSVTKAVTSRTRISTATLKAARIEMLKSNTNTSTTKATAMHNDSFNKNFEINKLIMRRLSVINASPLSLFRKPSNKDTQYSSREKTQLSEKGGQPLCSLGNPIGQQSTTANVKSFTYSDNEDDKILCNETIDQKQETFVQSNINPTKKVYTEQKSVVAEAAKLKQPKSFETAFIEKVFVNKKLQNLKQSRVSKSSTSEELLPTKNDSNVFVISDDEGDDMNMNHVESKPHLIFKNSVENITHSEIASRNTGSITSNSAIKNISKEIHSMSKYSDYCLLCNRLITRVVGHYVNAHPNEEVFISRPSPKMARILLDNKLDLATHDRLQNGLNLFIATCVFCEKKGSFTLPYWYQHFASHTGEYAYRCAGCGLRKPTRSQLSLHVRQNCLGNGSLEITHEYDMRKLKIYAYMCIICHYTQLNVGSVLNHLEYQHLLSEEGQRQYVTVTLLDASKTTAKRKRVNSEIHTSHNEPIYVIGENNEIFEIAEINDTNYTPDFDEQPVVVNEAEREDNLYSDPSAGSSNTPVTTNDPVNEIKIEYNM